MFGWVVAFFTLTLAAGFMGFTGLAGTHARLAQFLTVIFVLLFAVSILRSVIVDRHARRIPLP